jgi:hypothetical protein
MVAALPLIALLVPAVLGNLRSTKTLTAIRLVMQLARLVALKAAMCYRMSHRGTGRELEQRHAPRHNGRVRNEQAVDNLLEELAGHADAVIRLEAEAARHREAIRELLPKARAANPRYGPAMLERVIRSVYVKDTISRWTQGIAPPRGRKADQS